MLRRAGAGGKRRRMSTKTTRRRGDAITHRRRCADLVVVVLALVMGGVTVTAMETATVMRMAEAVTVDPMGVVNGATIWDIGFTYPELNLTSLDALRLNWTDDDLHNAVSLTSRDALSKCVKDGRYTTLMESVQGPHSQDVPLTLFANTTLYIACLTSTHCANGMKLVVNVAIPPVCKNGVKDSPAEADVDCGGPCLRCAAGKACRSAVDCVAGLTCSNASVCVATVPPTPAPVPSSSIHKVPVVFGGVAALLVATAWTVAAVAFLA